MMFQSKNKNALAIFAILAIIAIVAGLYSIAVRNKQETACTLEAKLCPDGSYVGRVGPRCEFAACPEDFDMSAWKTFFDQTLGVFFLYPEDISSGYVSATDWPPLPAVVEGPFTCTEAGSPTDRAGGTESRLINGRTYCVTEVSEGAAGSIYTQYAYAAPVGDDVAILTFSLRRVQCANYDEPERSECTADQASYSVDPLIDRIMQTIQVGVRAPEEE